MGIAAVCAMRMTVSCEHRGTRFPHTPARGRAWPSRRGRGNPGFPTSPPAGGVGRATPSSKGIGKPGFPIPCLREGYVHLGPAGGSFSGDD